MSDRSKNPPASEPAHPNIQEILAKRRETLNRVRADLRKVDQLQNDFWSKEKRPPQQL